MGNFHVSCENFSEKNALKKVQEKIFCTPRIEPEVDSGSILGRFRVDSVRALFCFVKISHLPETFTLGVKIFSGPKTFTFCVKLSRLSKKARFATNLNDYGNSNTRFFPT